MEKIVFFDGVCGLCNGFVDFLLKVDKQKKFKFSPLQSEYAVKHLPKEDRENLDSIVVLIKGKTYRKSKAVLAIFQELGSPWTLLSPLGLLPGRFLNGAYDLVARNRYKLFGQKDTCRIPTPAEKERFIL